MCGQDDCRLYFMQDFVSGCLVVTITHSMIRTVSGRFMVCAVTKSF